ncbi:MAG: globin [Hyphomonas sp.]|uniref:globin n=1 Tax=Hyphomonas sp. TaxID=87 RepID=UPI0035290F06
MTEPLTDSLTLLSDRLGDPTEEVYARLFRTHPDLEPLFSMDTDGGVRGSMLSQAFDCLMDLAEGPGRLAETVIRAERENHDTYDVPAGMFEVFFDIIRDVTKEAAGADWTPAMETAWTAVLAKADAFAAQQPVKA